MSTNSHQPVLGMDEDVLWLDQQSHDLGEKDLGLFRRIMDASISRGWDRRDARRYAYGRLIGSKLWAPTVIVMS